MDADDVLRWVQRYERAWRDGDLALLGEVFTEDAVYRRSPYAEPEVGLSAIRAGWLEDEGRDFTVSASPVAVDGRVAVVRLVVRYLQPHEQEYTDLWLLRFAADGRVEDFEEWAYWPGKAYSAEQ